MWWRWARMAALCALLAFSWGAARAGDEPDPASEDTERNEAEAAKSREERLREHQAKVREILDQRRQQRRDAADEKRRVENEGGAGPVKVVVPGAVAREEPPPQPQDSPSDAGAAEPGPAGAGQGGGSEIPLSSIILLISPLDTMARVGERFVTDIKVDNPAKGRMSGIALYLRYDPRFVKPVKVFDDSIRKILAAPPLFDDQPLKGRFYYEAQLKEPRSLDQVNLLTIVWEAVGATNYTEIGFAFPEYEERTTILRSPNGLDLLGLSNDPYDGVVGSSVLVLPREGDAKQAILQGKKEELAKFFAGALATDHKAGLALGAPAETPREGEEFDVPIWFLNPHGVSVDTIALYLRFDPQVLEVVDRDKGNWIRRGVNLFDGDRHMDFPFTFFVRNEAFNESGLIEYRNGLTRALPLPTGRLATIRFRAKAPSPGTTVEFIRYARGGYPNTAVVLNGLDVLDLGAAASVPRLRFPVLPGE